MSRNTEAKPHFAGALIDCGIGYSGESMPDKVKVALKAALDERESARPYGHVKALEEKLTASLDDTQEAVIAAGVRPLIFAALKTWLVGDRGTVLFTEPTWSGYRDILSMLGERVQFIAEPLHDCFQMRLTPEHLRTLLLEHRPDVFIMPCSNPSGVTYSHDELVAFANVLKVFPEVKIIDDAMYREISFTGEPALCLQDVCPDLNSRLFSAKGTTKSHTLRAGVGVGPIDVVREMKILLKTLFGAPMPYWQIKALACALDFPVKKEMLKRMQQPIKAFIRGAQSVDGWHVMNEAVTGSNYVLVDVDAALAHVKSDSVAQYCEKMKADTGVIAKPVISGEKHYLRFCLRTTTDVPALIARVSQWHKSDKPVRIAHMSML